MYEYEVEGPRPRGRPKRTWREVVREYCQARKLNTEDAMDGSQWRKLKRMSDDQDGCKWVSFLLVPAYPGSPGPTAVERLCVCVCLCVCLCLSVLTVGALTVCPELCWDTG